jgi:hypothetical protein
LQRLFFEANLHRIGARSWSASNTASHLQHFDVAEGCIIVHQKVLSLETENEPPLIRNAPSVYVTAAQTPTPRSTLSSFDRLCLLLLLDLQEESPVDVRQHTTEGDRRTDKGVELLVSADGKL